MRKAVRMSAIFAVSALLASSVVLAAEPVSRPDAGFKRVGPQTVTGGPTVDEYFARQADLHAWLMRETPAGSLANPISVRLTEAELDEINSIQPAGSGPLRVGTVKQLVEPVRLDCNAVGVRGQRVLCSGDGVLQMTPGGGFVWARAVTSPGAVGIRVHVTDFHLPDDADLYFYSLDGEAYGPFQRFGPNDNGDFWLPSVMSDTGVLVVRHFGPRGTLEISDVSMTFTEIGHIGEAFSAGANDAVTRAPGDLCPYNNQQCVLNASCENTGPAAPAESAAAKMLWIAGCCINVCSGGLIADTDAGSEIPYFLTANHCLANNNSAQNLEAFFQYTMSCGGSCPAGTFDPAPVTTKTLGATVMATGKKGDFTLLQLSQPPPAGSVFLGWNNTPIASNGGAELHRIHHPEGAPQAYSEHAVDANIGTCIGTPRGQFIYSDDVFGATELGSSGSPVVNASGDIVGQLTGCCPVGGGNCNDVCDPDNHTIDGALAHYYPNVAEFLDPSPCTPTTADCEDGIDNDCDGPIDCDDTDGPEDCSSFPACQSGCANPGGLPPGSSCTSNSQCCSNKCKGPPSNKTCR